MQKINTHKAISYQPLLYGYQPQDIATVMGISFVLFIFGFVKVAAIIFIVATRIFKRLKDRPDKHIFNVRRYLLQRRIFAVSEEKEEGGQNVEC